MADVHLDGKFIGTVDKDSFSQEIIEERRKGSVPGDVNVYTDPVTGAIHIESCKGRVRRPLIVVKDGNPLLLDKHIEQLKKNEICWTDLVKQGVIEYLDAAEEENAFVAFLPEHLSKEHTHLEIIPLAMFGHVASLVPFANHSQGTRVAMGGKNQKQALGFYTANFLVRMDMDVNLLQTTQKPIVQSVMHEISDYSRHPSGQNIVVAIMSYKGYNMDDAIVINQASIDRGFGRSTYFRPAVSEELRYAGGLRDEICIPDKDTKGYRSEFDYRLLTEEGVIYPEAEVKEGDVIIGKTSPPRFLTSGDEFNLGTNVRRESSVSLKHGEKGIVDFIAITENEEGNKLVQVRLRDPRVPEIGDKFTSRHGQKGVVGLIVPVTDMPFTANGVTPDLIFSPHGIPTRMTINHLIELVAGKVGCLGGRNIDGTTFSSETEADIRKEMQSLGFRENGTETLYNGITGKQYTARIFIGNMYYLKLKHLVANKMHSRARGPIQLLTRQPTEGRSKEGGLRLGEMEKDTFIAHGASLLLKERFDSDRTAVPVCEDCGMVAVYNSFKKKSYCPVCGENTEINNVELSYAFKLILDEFKALGVYPKMKLMSKY